MVDYTLEHCEPGDLRHDAFVRWCRYPEYLMCCTYCTVQYSTVPTTSLDPNRRRGNF